MNKKKIPFLLYREPTISCKQNRNTITFEYFNVKRYRYEVFQIDKSFSVGNTTEVEVQRKKVYTALKRGFSPDLDLIEGEFKTHIINMDDICKFADISWFYLILCEIRSWCADTSRRTVGGFVGFTLACEGLQLVSIIALLTKNTFFLRLGIIIFLGLYIISAIFFDIIIKKRIENKYHNHYRYLPSDFKNHIARIIIPIGVEAILGALYFYFKV